MVCSIFLKHRSKHSPNFHGKRSYVMGDLEVAKRLGNLKLRHGFKKRPAGDGKKMRIVLIRGTTIPFGDI